MLTMLSVRAITQNTEAVVVASEESGLEVNADITEYMVMYRDQNVGRSHSIKTDNISLERAKDFKYLETILTYQISIQKEIKSRLKLWNDFYHSVQNLLSSSMLSKIITYKTYRIIILPVVLHRCETWSLTLSEECRLKVYENRVLRRIFGLKWDEVTRGWKKLHNDGFNDLYCSPNIRVIKSR
jgi:hypothetical protein